MCRCVSVAAALLGTHLHQFALNSRSRFRKGPPIIRKRPWGHIEESLIFRKGGLNPHCSNEKYPESFATTSHIIVWNYWRWRCFFFNLLNSSYSRPFTGTALYCFTILCTSQYCFIVLCPLNRRVLCTLQCSHALYSTLMSFTVL